MPKIYILFLLKAFAEAESQGTNSVRTMDNGIVVRKSNLLDFIELCSPEKLYLANSEATLVATERFEYENSLMVYSNIKPPNLDLKDGKLKLKYLNRPPHPERFILDVNMISDLNTN